MQYSCRTIVMSKDEIGQEIQEQLSSVLQSGEQTHPTCTQQTNTANLTAIIKDAVVSEVSTVLEEYIKPILNELQNLRERGKFASQPALSCKAVFENDPTSPSGYYWIQASDGSAVRVHCDMTRTCGGVTGGWTRIAHLDMRESGSQCPTGLRILNYPPKRLCGINSDSATCSPVFYPTHGIEYTKVCGKIIAFQDATPDAFRGNVLTVDDNYVDGISLTHGRSPRQHIWTFAAALDEVGTHPQCNCPCTKINTNTPSPPSFVGNNYFCDTASVHRYQHIFYPDDRLWDGAGCGPLNTCCTLNNPPWFYRQLPPTSDNIEMRVCRDQPRADEDIPIETIELYIQ